MPLAIIVYGQDVQWADFGLVGVLVLLEGVLSIDNALVLGLLAKRLPAHLRTRALTYGLVGAFAFRVLAIGTAAFLLKWTFVKLLGGGYLVYVAIKHLFFEAKEEPPGVVAEVDGEPALVDERTGGPLTLEQETIEIRERLPVPYPDSIAYEPRPTSPARFWPTVLVIELTDIAFAVDSILAAVGLVESGPEVHSSGTTHPKLWIVVMGGLLGVMMMRFAAVVFIRLLERFPRFETAAYLLVTVIGGKLLCDWWFNSAGGPHRLDFHDWQHPEFWVFWGLMALSFSVGFLPSRSYRIQEADQ